MQHNDEQKNEMALVPPAPDAQIEQACRDITDYQRRTRYLGHKQGRFENTPGQYLGLLLWLLLGVMICAQFPNSSVALLVYFAVLSPFGAICIILWNYWQLWRRKQRYRNAQQILIAADSLWTLPMLLSVLKAERNNTGVTGALTRLLLRLKPLHTNVLDEEQRDFLCERLRPPYTPDLALECAILQAMEQIGDIQTRQFLDRRLRKFDMPPPLLQAMQQCREVLYEQELSAERAATLLRPGNAPVTPDAHLLRPTTATPPAQPEQLLRVVSNEDVQD